MGVEYARISAMLRGRRDIRTLELPGIELNDQGKPIDGGDAVEVGVRILIEEEIDEARLEAVQYINARAKKLALDPHALLLIDGDLLDREITRQLIFRAFVETTEDTETKSRKPFFPSPTAVRQLDSVLVVTLFEVYLDQQNFVNPLRAIDDAEVGELVDALGKERGVDVILSQYDAPSLRSLLHFLASELRTLRGGKSSTG